MRMPKIKQSRSKYNARKTIVDNIVFHSTAEANRYKILKVLEKSGHIKDLKLQVAMPYTQNGDIMFTYYADFTYYDLTKEVGDCINRFIIEDVKGMKTPVYRLKKKLIEAYYRVKITEVK